MAQSMDLARPLFHATRSISDCRHALDGSGVMHFSYHGTYSGSAVPDSFRFIDQAEHTARRVENTRFLLVDLSLY